MENIYSMGTQAWRQWVTYWTDKVKSKADLVDGKIPESQIPTLTVEPLKWKTYKALLTQRGADAPVARVLNQDEADYLGDIEWLRDDVGIYRGSLNFDSNMIFIISGDSQSVGVHIYNTGDGYVGIYVLNETDSQLNNLPIEIKVRQRGESPILLSAETNETGDKVILTFDKKMSEYGLDTVQYGDGIQINNTEIGVLLVEAFDKKIIIHINTEQIPNNETELNVSFMEGFVIESFDYGLLQPFENFPVVNNVVAF